MFLTVSVITLYISELVTSILLKNVRRGVFIQELKQLQYFKYVSLEESN